MKKASHLPPWKRPWQWFWLVLALASSLILIQTMPPGNNMRGDEMDMPSPAAASTADSPNVTPKRHGKAASNTIATPASPKAEGSEGGMMKKRHSTSTTNKGWWSKVERKASVIGKLLLMVSIAAMVGSIAEARKWHLIFGYILGRFSRLMRLPAIVSIAMPTALYSNTAANSMLVSSHAEGKIEHSTLIAGGMANSYLSYLSHSLRVMYPVLGAVGIPGALYFGGQFSFGFLFILGVLLWHRRRMAGKSNTDSGEVGTTDSHSPYEAPLSWGQTGIKAVQRVCTLLFRMMILTVPLMLLVEWMMKKGLFDFWEQLVPDWVNRIFPPELMSIVATQMGGLVQAAAVAANLRDHGAVTNAQILLAMFVGSAIGNPFRALRRNLPSALGIFPAREAVTIVVGMQLSRIIGVIILIVVTALFIHYTH